jgi:sortase A
MKAARWLAILLLVVGVSLTARALYLHVKADLAGILIRRAWEHRIQSGTATPPWPWADTYPIARLEIPRLRYDEIVLEGAAPRTLAFGPARLLSGAEVGGPGNLVLAGHRTSWFRPLEGIRRGDAIELQWYDLRSKQLRERRYAVREIRVVDPADLDLLGLTADDELTLLTCYPFGRGPGSPERFVVRADPVSGSLTADEHRWY